MLFSGLAFFECGLGDLVAIWSLCISDRKKDERKVNEREIRNKILTSSSICFFYCNTSRGVLLCEFHGVLTECSVLELY